MKINSQQENSTNSTTVQADCQNKHSNVLLHKISSLRSAGALTDVNLTLPPLQECYVHINYDVDFQESGTQVIQNLCPFPLAVGAPFLADVISIKKLTSGDDVKRVFDLRLDVAESPHDYLPGDTVGVVPCNPPEEVDGIIEHLSDGSSADKSYQLSFSPKATSKKASLLPHIPRRSTVRRVLETCLEARSVPKKGLLRLLATHTSDPSERRILEELSSREGSATWGCLAAEGCSLLSLLRAMPSCCPPACVLFQHLPRLRPRPYSIANSVHGIAGPLQVRVVLSVLEPAGLCTGWLASLARGQEDLAEQLASLSLGTTTLPAPQVPLFWRKRSGFHPPEDPSVPLLMIGPGTGVAPFLGFLEHREAQLQSSKSKPVGEAWLLFGCRYFHRDYIFRKELEGFVETGSLTRLLVSCSRDDDPSGARTKYVQENIRAYSQDIVNMLLDKQAMLYVCGDARRMAQDIREAVVDAIQQVTGVSRDSAVSRVLELQQQGRYQQDVWS